MAIENTTRRPIRPDIIGDTLNYLLTTKEQYEELTYIDQNQSGNSAKVFAAIKDVFSSYLKLDLSDSKKNKSWYNTSTKNLRQGDIIVLDNVKPESRYLVSYTGKGKNFTTWPRLTTKDQSSLKGAGIKTYNVIRPKISDISNSAIKQIESIALEVVQSDPDLQGVISGDNLSIQVSKNEQLSEGFLQIGDMGFLVDPTQISFTTQNGYQYFPTVRTIGSPKIPTIDQVKDISISLIFPNESSINYQLLNLVAMFKRSPFVNIRNKDICSFFKEITLGSRVWPNSWLSVALESLHIQSVEGFPNTLQAQVTVLPFDSKQVTPGFEALKSMKDVSIQQALLYNNQEFEDLKRISESKLNEQSVSSERFLDVIPKSIEKSFDFRESIPFRSFYQSMISNRKFITNEYGESVKAKGENLDVQDEYSVEKFRPEHVENRLHHYDANSNNEPVYFGYRFIPGEPHQVNKIIAEERQQEQDKILERLTQVKDNLSSPQDILREVVTSFHTVKDFYSEVSHRFNRTSKIVPRLLSDAGITLDSEAEQAGGFKPIEGLFSLIFRGALQRLGIDESLNFIKDGRELIEGKFDKDSVDYIGLLKNLVYYGSDRGIDNEGSITTAQGFINQISTWLNPTQDKLSEERKAKFAIFLSNIRRELISEYYFLENEGQQKLSVFYDVTAGGPSPFRVARIPIDEEFIEIDNKKDVITSFSIVFSNKFVPISLQAFKYPYYQHMGSNDAVLNLTIKSTGESTLKEDLSLLSERLYQTNKTLHLNAPELITYMDGRVHIESPLNHMFKAFGVHRVVFDNSNTTSDPNNPGCWNTNIGLTQANFTIEQYHKIEQVPTNNRIKQELAKLLSRIEIEKTGEDDRGRIVVKSYKQRKVANRTSSLGNDISKDKNPQSSNERHTLDDVTDMESLVRLRFVNSRHGETLSKHLQRLNESKRIQAKRRYERKVGFQRSLHNISSAHGASVGQLSEEYVPPSYTDPQPLGLDLSKDLGYLESTSSDYESDVRKILDKTFIIGRDAAATNSLNELLDQYPLFDKIIRYVVKRFDSLLERETKAIMNLFQLDRTFLEIFFGIDRDLLSLDELPDGVATSGAALVSALSFSAGGILGVSGGILGALVATFRLADTGIKAAVQGQRQALVDKFNGFFLRILDDFNMGALHSMGSQIYRDPVIREKFIRAGIITPSSADVIQEANNRVIVNCYNDFDIPLLSDESYFLAPDFYLHNQQLDRAEAETYIRESFRRHARIGKLTALMTLQEKMDVIEEFDDILNQIPSLDSNVLRGTSKIIFEGEVASDIDEAKNILGNKLSSLRETFTKISRATRDLNSGTISDEQFARMVSEYKETYPKQDNESEKEFQERFENFRSKLALSRGNVDPDQRKINLIYSARMSTLFKIFERFVALNQYMDEKIGGGIQQAKLVASANDIIGKGNSESNADMVTNKQDPSAKNPIRRLLGVKKEYEFLTKQGSDLRAVEELYSQIKLVLEDAENLTTERINLNKNNEKYITLKRKLNGGIAVSDDTKYLSLPAIRNMQTSLYNDIGFYIRLNTFIQNLSETQTAINLDSLPELKYLDFWNFREREALSRRNEITKEFAESYKDTNHNSIKLFPTFKIFFIEEDKGIWRSNDDYYSHNAVQSIDIIDSKEAAGKTAIVRLSNVTNTITNRLSFHREAKEALLSYDGDAQDAFFGTLDVKPGTPIMIKMGYAPNDRYLETLFVGRIIEMNAGPVVEMVCQSYGSQLNHHNVAEHFGLLASRVREHGDVAAALLDTIPGLEKLGKIPMYGLTTGDFSGKNLRNVRGKVGDRFLLGNILGSVSALTFAQDNPRDENIYLPFSLVPELFHRPTFDWIVYNQSVWESLQELALYNRNATPMVRLYNTDPISFNNDVRETLVFGDKSGYYKYTDAFSLSTMNVREIDEAREHWNKLKAAVRALNAIGGRSGLPLPEYTTEPTVQKIANNRDALVSALFNDIPITKTENDGMTTYLKALVLKPEYHDLWLYLQKPLNAKLLVANVLDKIGFNQDAELSLSNLLSQAIGSNDIIKSNDGLGAFINNLLQFSNSTNLDRSELSREMGTIYTDQFSTNVNFKYNPAESFLNALMGLSKLTNKYKTNDLLDIPEESFYNIRNQDTNRSDELIGDPRYKKIQTHHLITDIRDIISNKIALNSQFANAVNVFFTGEPSIKTASPDDVREAVAKKDINLWETKAFGNIKDEHLRILNSYQKNIDTNFWDIADATDKFFKGFKRIKLDNGEVSPKAVSKLMETQSALLDTPRWDMFPSFVVVGISLLKSEVTKMYQGTLELVGKPKIKPYDIIHLQDYTNDMHGAIEVQEVIHTFTPEAGFRTIITPNLITYDRDPIQLQDVQIINNITEFANQRAIRDTVIGGAALLGTLAGWIGGPITGIPTTLMTAPILYNSTVGGYSRYHKFMYDQLGNILGRDCINFTSLIYHGSPYMAGFDGVDYTSLKTLINQKVENIKDPIARFAAFSDPLQSYITTNGNPQDINKVGALINHFVPFTKALGGYPSDSRLGGFLNIR